MEDVVQDVNEVAEPSTETQEVVNEQATDQPEVKDIQEEQPQVEPSPTQNTDLYDERGVPWANVAHEYQRKYDSTQEKLSSMEETLNKIAETQSQSQQKYSIEDLEAFANNPDTDDANRAWAAKEISKLREQKIETLVNEKVSAIQQENQFNQQREKSLHDVQKLYPDAFVKDQSGNPVNWNAQNPLTQRIGYYMQNPAIANDPSGLLAAAKMAYADVAANSLAQGQKSQATMNNSFKKLQKQTLVEGGTPSNAQVLSAKDKAINASRSGTQKDAQLALGEIFRAKGVLP